MRYDYFGNTSLRVKNLLYNFETQLLLFEELFTNAHKEDIWANDSRLQIKYLELLEQNNLLESKSKTTHLGTKDARVKSAPLEDYKLINRKQKRITKEGYELLNFIKTKSYQINNDFLQIDLISLLFLKATLCIDNERLFFKYLEVFKAFNGSLDIEIFKLLPLVNNFKNTELFTQTFKNKNLFSTLFAQDSTYMENLELFLKDLNNNVFKIDYFKTAKGDKTALAIIKTLKEVFLPFRNSKDEKILEKLMNSNDYLEFKKLYLPHLSRKNKKQEKLKDLVDFCDGNLNEFGTNFFEFIFKARIQANLNDYLDLNRRYLNLTGIFEFQHDKVELNTIFKIILKHSRYKEILEKIAQNSVSQSLLKEYFDDEEFKQSFKELGIVKPQDVKNYKSKQDKEKLKNLLQTKFTKTNIIEILKLFEERKNDTKILEKTSIEANIPTIFEYIIAIAWHYIDDNKIERIFEANLSLDSSLLPKSHAVGGNADFVYIYDYHRLMIEVTLSEKTNQRRAEMESVSRHLGNLLLSLDADTQNQSYAIFIAPYLDKNVLNDFRSRMHCYFENDKAHIKGMKILPLSTNDLVKILQSNLNYQSLLPKFQKALKSDEQWGSKWYEEELKAMVDTLAPNHF
ncbi:AlwI family type II restriction endonuclease [Helicobacter himalayensis]|uniref:AlwI family type II restriction endonuclease n=1 Tax=Helicobacter himalayensis TaxID=1591088 RepID=UPI00082C2FCD|nr:AlwI family type II restriction endonuclease [Helicobacter himalayensis]